MTLTDDVVAGVTLTHPDRVLYPGQDVTKRDLALYYEAVADHVIPHLVGRPATLVRCPEGIGRECFYQKHVGFGVPDAVRRVKIKEKTKVGEYLLVDTLPMLVSLVQIGVLEFHTWNSTADHLEQPDRLVFDLDPDPSVPFSKVAEAARRLEAVLRGRDMVGFVKTTGGKGLHVVTPIVRGPGWDVGLDVSRAVVEKLAAEDPDAFTTTMSKEKRRGKIFLDYLRNARGATSVAAFSTRARPGAPVSVPLAWRELDDPGLRPDGWNVANLPKRLAALRQDPWAEYAASRSRVTVSLKKTLGLA